MIYKKEEIYGLGLMYANQLRDQKGISFAMSRRLHVFMKPIMKRCKDIEEYVQKIREDLKGKESRIIEELEVLNKEDSDINPNMAELMEILEKGKFEINPGSLDMLDILSERQLLEDKKKAKKAKANE